MGVDGLSDDRFTRRRLNSTPLLSLVGVVGVNWP